jgi:hypothetical protein
MYTLNFGHGVHESGDYIVNLSTDAETAVKKAMSIMSTPRKRHLPVLINLQTAEVSINDIIEKGYLAISIGEENKMFTLRSHSTHIDGWGNAVESSYHVTNLSTDPEQARNKARAIAKEREMPLNNTSWVSNSSLDTIDRKSKEELDALKADKEKRIARAKEISAKIELNYHTLMWSYYMANSCKRFDDLQKVADVAELNTENRITLMVSLCI